MELCLEGSGFLLREKGNPRVISDLFLHDPLNHCFNHRAVSCGMTLKRPHDWAQESKKDTSSMILSAVASPAIPCGTLELE